MRGLPIWHLHRLSQYPIRIDEILNVGFQIDQFKTEALHLALYMNFSMITNTLDQEVWLLSYRNIEDVLALTKIIIPLENYLIFEYGLPFSFVLLREASSTEKNLFCKLSA